MTSACLSYKSAYQRRHHAEKALADDFPFDLPRLIDGVAPNERENEKCVWVFFFPPSTVGRKRDETHPQTNTLSSLCMSYKRSLTRNNPENSAHTHVICLLLWIRHTHTPTLCYAAVLTDGPRGGPHLPKCRCWTDCGGVMNG